MMMKWPGMADRVNLRRSEWMRSRLVRCIEQLVQDAIWLMLMATRTTKEESKRQSNREVLCRWASKQA